MGSRNANIIATASSIQKKTESVVFIHNEDKIKKKPLCDILKVDLSFQKKVNVSGVNVYVFHTKKGHSVSLVSERYARIVYKERSKAKASRRSTVTKSTTKSIIPHRSKRAKEASPAETHHLKRAVSDDLVKTSLIDHNPPDNSDNEINLSVIRRWINPIYIPL